MLRECVTTSRFIGFFLARQAYCLHVCGEREVRAVFRSRSPDCERRRTAIRRPMVTLSLAEVRALRRSSPTLLSMWNEATSLK